MIMCLVVENFNPRSHKGSDQINAKDYKTGINFNPRSHKGSDEKCMGYDCKMAISIHAPTRGATSCVVIRNTDFRYFNPRSHKGSDHSNNLGLEQHKLISIHAPTRGATDCEDKECIQSNNFNPRSHKGSDSMVSNKRIVTKQFQSTLPQGERRNPCYILLPLH